MSLHLVYFPTRGRAELIRLIMATAGQEWKETSINSETLKEWKDNGSLTFSQVPLLQDGDFNLVQSNAIARYLARKYNLYGDLKTGAITDMILDGCVDFSSKLIPAIYPTFNAEKYEELKKNVFPSFFNAFEKLAPTDGFIGESLSLGDLALFLIAESYIYNYNIISEDNYPKLAALKKRVEQNANLSTYLLSDKRFPSRKLG